VYNANVKKKLRSSFKKIRASLSPLQLEEDRDFVSRLGPMMEPYAMQRLNMGRSSGTIPRYGDDYVPSNDEVDKINRDKHELAKLNQSYEAMDQSARALNLTLKSQHRLLVATLITALVALVVGIISLFNKPPVVNVTPPVANVQPPTVNVQPPEVKVYTIPQQ
jgi:hypothetical protein